MSARYQRCVLMAEPVCEREEIHACPNCRRAKQMPAIVMAEPMHAEFSTGSVDCLLALPDREDISSNLALPAPRVPGIGLQIVKQSLHCRDYRNPPSIATLRTGVLVSSDPDRLSLPLDVGPFNPTRFVDATA